jgi:inner membrane protein
MDPLSHVIFGRTLIALDRRGRFDRGAVAAAALGAIAPDIDAIAIWRGWDVYLHVHEMGTHSIAGSVAVACATATLVYSVKREGRYGALILAAWIGALSHVIFDLVSGARLKLGWPVLQGRSSIPLVAMADPWLIAICTVGAGALWVSRRRTPAVAGAVVTAIAAFLALKGAMMAFAVPQWTAATSGDRVVHHAVEASWSSLTRWEVFDRTPHALRQWRVDALTDRATLLLTYPLHAEPPIVDASRSLDTVRNFLGTHQLGFAVATVLDNGTTRVLWSDIRYCTAESNGITEAGNRTSVACALWFGGTLDRDGRALTQIVRVGEWLQTRPAEP